MKTYSFTKLEQIRQCDTGAEINKVTAGLEDKASTWTHTYIGLWHMPEVAVQISEGRRNYLAITTQIGESEIRFPPQSINKSEF